ncbi:MAG: hypothetical protein SF051_02480, partial [Elusimicrobiota bacterium]|nr:hypothetical protein [Elusimicrobiota bacterium]
MLTAALACLLVHPAAALVVAPSQTLEALRAEAVRDPASDPRSEGAAGRAGQGFDAGPFHVKTLTPVEHLPAAAARAEAPGPVVERPAPPRAETP